MNKIKPVIVTIPAQVVFELKRIAAEFSKIDGKVYSDNDVFEWAINIGMDAMSARIKHEKSTKSNVVKRPANVVQFRGAGHVH